MATTLVRPCSGEKRISCPGGGIFEKAVCGRLWVQASVDLSYPILTLRVLKFAVAQITT